MARVNILRRMNKEYLSFVFDKLSSKQVLIKYKYQTFQLSLNNLQINNWLIS